MNIRTLAFSVALAVTLTACATPSTPYLNDAINQCGQGNDRACANVPVLQAQVAQERAQAAQAASAALVIGLTSAAAIYSASHPAPTYNVVVVCRPWQLYC
jgi:hypothetical protein